MKFLLACLGLALAAPAARSAPPPPNVVYILADDLGYGDLSCYGQKKFATPHIDRLAAAGMTFSQHYCGSPVCAPSRAVLLTGLHSGHAPVRGNAALPPEGQQPMPADTFTLAQLFKEAGYTTGLFGKWGLGAPDSVSEPLRMGFDRFYGYNCQRQAHFYYPYFLWNDHQREMLWGNVGLERGEYAPERIQRQALAFLDTNRARPFFLYYAPTLPHAELAAPEAYLARYRGKFLPEQPYVGVDSGPKFRSMKYGSQAEPHAAYAAMVNVLDDYVGELMAKLEALGLADHTLVIFASDNGPHHEGGNDPAYFASSGPYRGVKRDVYEGGIRVPMIASWPGQVAAGSHSDHLSGFWDVLPTMADLIGRPLSHPTDGLSFLPTLLGRSGQQEHEYLYWEFHEGGGRVAIRRGDWKGVRYDVATNPASPLELYDLARDPGETTNVAAQHPDVVAALEKLLQGARTVSPVPDFNFPLKRTMAAEE